MAAPRFPSEPRPLLSAEMNGLNICKAVSAVGGAQTPELQSLARVRVFTLRTDVGASASSSSKRSSRFAGWKAGMVTLSRFLSNHATVLAHQIASGTSCVDSRRRAVGATLSHTPAPSHQFSFDCFLPPLAGSFDFFCDRPRSFQTVEDLNLSRCLWCSDVLYLPWITEDSTPGTRETWWPPSSVAGRVPWLGGRHHLGKLLETQRRKPGSLCLSHRESD